MIQVLNIMYIFIHLCDDLQYLLVVTYIMICNGFVFLGLQIIHWAWVAHPFHLSLFQPRCESIGYYWMAATLYSIMWLNEEVYMYLEVWVSSVVICNYLEYM